MNNKPRKQASKQEDWTYRRRENCPSITLGVNAQPHVFPRIIRAGAPEEMGSSEGPQGSAGHEPASVHDLLPNQLPDNF